MYLASRDVVPATTAGRHGCMREDDGSLMGAPMGEFWREQLMGALVLPWEVLLPWELFWSSITSPLTTHTDTDGWLLSAFLFLVAFLLQYSATSI